MTRLIRVVLFALPAFSASCKGPSPQDSNAQTLSPPVTQAVDASRRTAITEATARVAPAVVTVQTETVERVPLDIFEMFFGGRSSERISPT